MFKKILIGLLIVGLILINGLLDIAKGLEINNEEQNFVIMETYFTRFEPDADFWYISFSLLTTLDLKSKPILKSITINEMDIKDTLETILYELPIIKIEEITMSQLIRWNELRGLNEKGLLLNKDLVEFQELHNLVLKSIEKSGNVVDLEIITSKLPFKIEEGKIYPLKVEIQYENEVQNFITEVYIQSLPDDDNWIPAQLHVHTTYSSELFAKKTPLEVANIYKSKGYKVVYITDHTNGIQQHGWSNYIQEISNASSQSGIAVYPGGEMGVLLFTYESHLLAYGIADLNGLENKVYDPQTGIYNILNNNYYQSSAAIAHPCGAYPWIDWSVHYYSGFELMSGYQTNFSDSATPMVRWRSELTRLLSDALNTQYRPSARTGDDFHSSESDYVTYLYTQGFTSQIPVDLALLKGKTVASRKGGLAYFTFERNGIVKNIGEVLYYVPTNSKININVTFNPIISGTYYIKIYEDNKVRQVFSKSGSYSAGITYNFTSSFTFNGGQHYYYLYIYSNSSLEDYIYSTPIYVTN